MNSIAILKRVLPFFAGLAIGTVPILLWTAADSARDLSEPEFIYGRRACKSRPDLYKHDEIETIDDGKLRIISKPRPGYTDEARQKNTEGTVVLKVEFLSTGKIGLVRPMKELPNGLTEQAIEAAQRIDFEPAEMDGSPITVVKQVEYTFSIY